MRAALDDDRWQESEELGVIEAAEPDRPLVAQRVEEWYRLALGQYHFRVMT